MPKVNIDHLVLLQPPAIDRNYRADCWHCGATLQIVLPVPMVTFDRLLRKFVRDHRKCIRPAHIVEQPAGVLCCQQCQLTVLTALRGDVAPFIGTHAACQKE